MAEFVFPLDVTHVKGGVTRLELPWGRDIVEMTRLFDTACTVINDEWRARRALPTRGEVSHERWIRRAAYVLLVHCLDEDIAELFEDRIGRFGRRVRGKVGQDNVLQDGVMALFAHAEYVEGYQRERIWRDLWLAYRHYVPQQFLAGFLYQTSNERHRVKEIDWLDPVFLSWIIDQRVAMECGNAADFRGLYPAEVEESVAAKRKQLIKDRYDRHKSWDDDHDDDNGERGDDED